MQKTTLLFFFLISAISLYGQNTDSKEKETPTDSLKTTSVNDTVASLNVKTNAFKNNVIASYYANKFNGRRTASGTKFDNNKYTAAHKKLPFGTKVKVTNPVNKKFVIVVITDRGPFVRSREIDLSRRAFMDLANNKSSGILKVNIEIVKE